MRPRMVHALLAIALAAPAVAQIGNPAGMTAGTPQSEPGKPAPHQPNAQDRLFVQLMASGGMAEVDAAKLADAKARDPAVKAYARAMVQDHAAANEKLMALGRQGGIALPRDLDADHKAMHEQLEMAEGAQFDIAYVHGQLVDHQKTVQILEWELGGGQDADLQRFAAATLPIVMRHLELAQALMSQLTNAAPQGLASTSATTSALASQQTR